MRSEGYCTWSACVRSANLAPQAIYEAARERYQRPQRYVDIVLNGAFFFFDYRGEVRHFCLPAYFIPVRVYTILTLALLCAITGAFFRVERRGFRTLVLLSDCSKLWVTLKIKQLGRNLH